MIRGKKASARALARTAVERVEQGGRADEVLSGARLEPRDAAFARELALGVLRHQRLLRFVLEGFCDRGLPEGPPLHVLEIGAQQLLFMDRVPDHAAVQETVALAGRARGFVNAVLRSLTRSFRDGVAGDPCTELQLPGGRFLALPRPLPDPQADPVRSAALLFSLPDFLVERWVERLGAETATAVAAASATTPAVFLRASARSGGAETLAGALAEEGVETEGVDPDLLRWSGGRSPFAGASFRQGGFVVQDPTALEAARAVGARPGERILDLCAAPGTKASFLAEQVGPEGRVFAFDPDVRRRRRIEENARRLGLPNLVTVDSPKAQGPYVRVLVDAPCSNTGVLARRVEVRRRLQPETFAELAHTQTSLLEQALGLVHPKGEVLYSTCSIEPEENGELVRAVTAAAEDWKLREDRLTLPAVPAHDGGYWARLGRA